MNYDHQKDVNVNHQKFLDGLEKLAISAAEAQAQIASDAAKHEFRIRFNHYLQEKMKIAAEETYAEVLQEVQEFVNQFAIATSTRALNVESITAPKISGFKPATPQFASFSETLSAQRNKQSNLLRLNDVEINSEADKLALSSLGIAIENEHQPDETNEVNNDNWNT